MHTDTPTVALTGGIASGKSAVAAEFAKLGVPVIDTDEIARAVVEPGQPALQAVIDHFGKDILDRNGKLDRKQLRERIFKNPAEKQALETILHPAIRAEQLHRAKTAGGEYQLHVVPLLTETGNRHLYGRVLVVDCAPETQLQRLIARDGIARDLAERMLAAQATREQRLAIADDVIDNSGDPALLAAAVTRLHQRYLKDLAKAP
ncbi:MAG: dephospho-CoA kinase [Steroidobacter sp.]